MTHTEQRQRLRAILTGSQCLSPASVFDPLSARIAESVGYEIGMLAGSVAASTTLAAPDCIVLTLTEFADQVRRIMRASRLSLIVDADHGYGNALNVMRTIHELEHAGVSALSIEDTALPTPFGQPEGTETLISIEEMVGKLRAAVAARQAPSLIIAGRTAAPKVEDIERAVVRAKAYAATGVDALFIVGAGEDRRSRGNPRGGDVADDCRIGARCFHPGRPRCTGCADPAPGASAHRGGGQGAARHVRASVRGRGTRRSPVERRLGPGDGTPGRDGNLHAMAARVPALTRVPAHKDTVLGLTCPETRKPVTECTRY
jgi:ketopantoate hydroxymethyltransferase